MSVAEWSSRWLKEHNEVHRLSCEGAFSLKRDPFTLMPAVEAYANGEISGGRMRECIREWLSGVDFLDPANRTWEGMT